MTYLRAGALAAALELAAGALPDGASDDDDEGAAEATVDAVGTALALADALATLDARGAGIPVSVRAANCGDAHAATQSTLARGATAKAAKRARAVLRTFTGALAAYPEAAC